MQIKTIQFLQSFLEDPKAGISLILTSYKFDEIITISKIDEVFIERWLVARVTKAAQFHGIRVITLESLYDGYNINHILTKCNLALKKLSPEKDQIGEHRDDSDTRETYSKYLKLSALGDLTHTKLRNATCYLDDGVKEECIKTIKAVTDSEDNFFMQAFSERLKQTLHRDIAEYRDKNIPIMKLTSTRLYTISTFVITIRTGQLTSLNK
ncbi:unnamed protein product [Mytilus edulis]|uniref:Uncharacterized protein n=1 Tax=Mytilus edulis TaxID=6550 RepID=A0A8S3UYH4_MYTED|nr:unnamed protein product [Mytilus edulis]